MCNMCSVGARVRSVCTVIHVWPRFLGGEMLEREAGKPSLARAAICSMRFMIGCTCSRLCWSLF